MSTIGRLALWVNRIMGIASAVIGLYGNWNDALQVKTAFGLSWQQLAFTIFVVAVLITVVESEIRYRKLEKARPRATIIPTVTDNTHAVLRVQNDGIGGDFSVTARVKSGAPSNDVFNPPWESNGQTRCHVDGGGGEATLLIAEKSVERLVNTNEDVSGQQITYKEWGKLLLATVRNGKKMGYTLFGWDVDKLNSDISQSCVLEITVTSEPTLANPFKRQLFQLEMAKGHLLFSRLSNTI